jgi:L-asparagine transporter-like permease
MVSKFLLPNKFKLIGWILLIPSFIMGVMWVAGYKFVVMSPVFAIWANPNELFTIIYKDIYNELVSVPLLISLMMVSFSKEKNEDEYITKIRLDSLLWSIYINYSFLFFALIFVFRSGFHNIMIYNMFTVLILFIVKFYLVLYRNKVQFEME